jgi:demethylspheroidene O-methyltransferase
VVDRAAHRLAEAGLQSRTRIVGGSFLTDPIPTGADIVSLIRVLHDHDDRTALAILHRAYDALPEDGVLLVAEPMSDTAGARPIGDAYFGFYLEAMRSGRPRTRDELADLIHTAGFQEIRVRPTRTPMLVSVLTGRARGGRNISET